jgi:hypothetical protein
MFEVGLEALLDDPRLSDQKDSGVHEFHAAIPDVNLHDGKDIPIRNSSNENGLQRCIQLN